MKIRENKKEFGWIRKETKRKGERTSISEREKGEKGFPLHFKIYRNQAIGFRRSEK